MAASAAISKPICRREIDLWLNRIATPAEKDRAVALLATLRPETEEQPSQQQERHHKPAAQQATDTAEPDQHSKQQASPSGWTYAATSTALQRGTMSSGGAVQTHAYDGGRPASPASSSYAHQQTPAGYPVPSRTKANSSHTANHAAAGAQLAAQAKKQAWASNTSSTSNTGPVVTPGSPRSVAYSAPDVPADVTTYHMAYHLAQMYPELYAEALAGTKAAPAPNGTFISDWGNSLKSAEDADWRARFLRSVYDATNAEVHPNGTVVRIKGRHGAAGQPGEAGFFRWLQRQQTYYRRLLKAGLLTNVDTQLSGTPSAQQHAVLDTLRQFHAVARPDLYMPQSQTDHCFMRPAEDHELTSMEREMTRVRTMGFPPPQVDGTYMTLAMKRQLMGDQPLDGTFQQVPMNNIDIVFNGAGSGPRPYTASAAGQPYAARRSASSQGAGLPHASAQYGSTGTAQRPASASATMQGKRTKATPLEKQTLKSQLPIKWAAAASLGIPTSTYSNAFGSLAAGASRQLAAAAASKPVRYKEVTAPIGAVNPNTAMVPPRPAYPVPDYFTTAKAFPQDTDAVLTTNREQFAARSPEDVLRTIKASAAATATAKARLNKSTLPLGPNALCMLPPADWASEHQDNYVEHKVDVAGDYERAQTLKRLLGGPTAAGGRLTAQHYQPAPRRPVVAA